MIDADKGENLLAGMVKQLIKAVKLNMENRIPCEVTAISDDRSTVSVKPLIKIVSNADEELDRGEIKGIKVFTAGAGGMIISFPISVGDIGWLEACDRDISLFLQSYAESSPPTERMHSFSDAHFMPDAMTGYTISEEDEGALVVQTTDAVHKISLSDSGLKVTSTSNVDINGATITPTGDVVTAGGVSLDEFKAEYDAHTHAYTWTGSAGSGNTGTPA